MQQYNDPSQLNFYIQSMFEIFCMFCLKDTMNCWVHYLYTCLHFQFKQCVLLSQDIYLWVRLESVVLHGLKVACIYLHCALCWKQILQIWVLQVCPVRHRDLHRSEYLKNLKHTKKMYYILCSSPPPKKTLIKNLDRHHVNLSNSNHPPTKKHVFELWFLPRNIPHLFPSSITISVLFIYLFVYLFIYV